MAIKLMPDYECYPLWRAGGEVGNMDPRDLPLSPELIDRLEAWARVFDSTLNQEYPPDSKFSSPAAKAEFEAEGRQLWRDLQSQLGQDYVVVYFSVLDSRVHTTDEPGA